MLSTETLRWLRRTAEQAMQDECTILLRVPGAARDSRGRVVYGWPDLGLWSPCYVLTPDPEETPEEVRLTRVKLLLPLGTTISHVDRVRLASQPANLYEVVGEITQRVDHLVVHLDRVTE